MSVFGKDIGPETVCIFPGGLSKYDALNEMIDSICGTNVVTDREAFQRALFERESIRSTGFRTVAIPHVRIDEILQATVGIGISKEGIDFEALDSEPVHIVVLFAMPSGSDKEYLGFLAKVMMALRTDGFCERLMDCPTVQDVLAVLEEG